MKHFMRLAAFCLALAIGIVYYLDSAIEPVLESELFCAYNTVFVKFKEGKHIWGTVLLDSRGSPVHCNLNELEKVKRIENSI
jgi:hypothetical protein